jgi:hypothetical protein
LSDATLGLLISGTLGGRYAGNLGVLPPTLFFAVGFLVLEARNHRAKAKVAAIVGTTMVSMIASESIGIVAEKQAVHNQLSPRQAFVNDGNQC